MISTYRELFPLMQPDLPSIPDPLLLQELQGAGRDFCRDTEAWREYITMDIDSDLTDYVLRSKYNAEILRPRWVWTNGDRTGEPIDISLFDFRPETQTLSFNSDFADDLTDGLIVEVTLMPRLFTEELAGHFMEKWAEGIVARAKVRLMSMKDKPWSSPERVQFFNGEYSRYLSVAHRDRLSENKQTGVRFVAKEFIP